MLLDNFLSVRNDGGPKGYRADEQGTSQGLVGVDDSFKKY